MTIFSFDVGVTTHDKLKQGIIVDHYRRVVVAQDDDDHTAASLTAIQMAGVHDFYVTDCLTRI